MAVTKSTLNSKLPSVSKIAFCTAAGKNMFRTIFTGENGKFSSKVGFKQSSTTYPFQIQYRTRSRYTKENAKVKGANWTKWSSWKNAVAVSGIAKDATESSSPVNKWLKANKGVNSKSKYQTFYTFSSYQIADTYDARQFEFRIRTFNKAKAKHGAWTSQILNVYKCAAVKDETYYASPNGGLICDFNYKWDRNYLIQINSIKDSNKRELLVKKYKTTANTDSQRSSSTTPALRSGYVAGTIEIPLNKLKREIVAGENLTVDIQFVTEDKGTTKLESHQVLDTAPSIGAMVITPTWDEATGTLTATVTKSVSGDVIDSLGCLVSYTYHGKDYSIEPVESDVDVTADTCGVFTFFPPLGIPLTITAKSATYRSVRKDTAATIMKSAGYRLNSHSDTSICAVAWCNPSIDTTSYAVIETALPFGRKQQIAFYGEGEEDSISISAQIVDNDENQYGGIYATRHYWDKVRENQGIYTLRTSKGDMYKVALQTVSIVKNVANVYDVTVDMVEVL